MLARDPLPLRPCVVTLAVLVAGCDAGSQSTPTDAGTGAESVLACSAPVDAPSMGSCITAAAAVDGGPSSATIACNPVTNYPCPSGSACDVVPDSADNPSGFACFGGNSAGLCQLCSNSAGPLCTAGLTCVVAVPPEAACARYCCANADCGDAGVCVTTDSTGRSLFSPIAPNLGVCAAQ